MTLYRVINAVFKRIAKKEIPYKIDLYRSELSYPPYTKNQPKLAAKKVAIIVG